MGGVDYLDSKVAVYRITIRSKKWWWAHFINTLDCLKAASYMVDKLANPNEKHISYLEFIRRIVISYLPRRDVVVRRPIQRAAIWKGDNRVAPERRLDKKDHWPEYREKQARCAYKNCKRKPMLLGGKCMVALCAQPCFKLYHTQVQ